MSRHMVQYMSRAQKGVGSDTRGAEHQLLVDVAVSRECKTRKANLYTAWIDCKKTYESMQYMDAGVLEAVQDQGR